MFERWLGSWLALGVTLSISTVSAQETSDRELFADRVRALLTVVEAQHIAPPTREELIASGIAQLGELDGMILESRGERVPAIGEAPELRARLTELFDAARPHAETTEIVNAMVAGISRRIPGGATTIDAETARINDSFNANRYVGVGVVLDFKGGLPLIQEAYHGGPAHRAGIRAGDVIYEVDGIDTVDMELGRFLGYSRDEEGTELVYVVGRPDTDERRTVRMTRAEVPRETVVGTARDEDDRWDFGLSSAVAYVKLSSIASSTPHELRKAGERIRRNGHAALVLDLRGCRATFMHDAALVADLFLEDGVLGASASRLGRTEYRAGPEALFDCGAVVLLVDGRTRGTPEWLAAVLRQGGAALVGDSTAGVPFIYSRVEIPGWPVEVRMATAWILDPEEGDPAEERRAMASIRPDVLEVDAERALDRALEFLGVAPSTR